MANKHSLPLVLNINTSANENMVITKSLGRVNFSYATLQNPSEYKSTLLQLQPDIVIMNCDTSDKSFDKETLEFGIKECLNTRFIVTSSVADPVQIVQYTKWGAYDYLLKPLEPARIVTSISNALKQVRADKELRNKIDVPDSRSDIPSEFDEFIGNSIVTLSALKKATIYSKQTFPILIVGEHGTGKRLLSQLIHKNSIQSGDYVSITIDGLDDDTFYREFYNAISSCKHGTLYISDISKTTKHQQQLILRWFQDMKIRFPEHLNLQPILIEDVRLVCGSTESLDDHYLEGLFDQNLYYRLTANVIDLAPLRQNKSDISVLLDYFLSIQAKKLGKRFPSYPKELISLLKSYPFPGNAFELSTMAENAMAYYEKGILSLTWFARIIEHRRLNPQGIPPHSLNFAQAMEICEPLIPLKNAKAIYIQEVLRRTNNNQAVAARIMGLSRQAVNSYLLSLSQNENSSVSPEKIINPIEDNNSESTN